MQQRQAGSLAELPLRSLRLGDGRHRRPAGLFDGAQCRSRLHHARLRSSTATSSRDLCAVSRRSRVRTGAPFRADVKICGFNRLTGRRGLTTMALRVAGCCFALILLLTAKAPGRTAADSRPGARCANDAVLAVIAGKHVCLKAAQHCSSKHESVYQRYGFTCARRRRLTRLVRSQLARSLYLSVSKDRRVHERTVLIAAQLDLPKPDTVFFESDGTFAPAVSNSAASVFIRVDGTRVSNVSTVDWRRSVEPVRHSFNAVGVASLVSGRHTVALVGQPLAGAFTVGASSNLSVLVHPAQHVRASELATE